MLKVRVIPVMLHRDFGLVKGVGFDSRRTIGNPMQAVKVYNMRQVDELVLMDIAATLAHREPDYLLVDDLADECFMPLTVGGGVRTVEHVQRLLKVGADKVAVGTGLAEVPGLLAASAARFGRQCMMASIDYRHGPDGPHVWIRCGTERTNLHPVDLARRVEAEGAGEILLTSIDRDGTMSGYDLVTLREVADAVSVPVIAAGGAATYDDFLLALRDGGAAAVAAASMFHFTERTPLEAKAHLAAAGLPVRR